ncbi:MAG: alpha-amylase family protein [Anditalea sp.]
MEGLWRSTEKYKEAAVVVEHKIRKRKSEQKIIIYQVFTRLFGNTSTTNKPWGTIEENGVGKFHDFTDKALQEIRALGITHIWYTGVPHHALINDYTTYGISPDDPDVVKGRAGSPYAVKDYYDVNPDLATDPGNRLGEFKNLIDRTHKNGMKVLIDIVPNHIARRYEGQNNPEGVEDFGVRDDSSVTYRRDNNYYYNPGENFQVPVSENGYQPLGGELHPLADGKFEENPAKWTGNGSRLSQPHFNDWYETVKINYGIAPDGGKDFPLLPAGFDQENHRVHFNFWQGQEVPDSWVKFRDIAQYWMEMGVDGFRYDMAEMIPVEFWSYLNSAIKMRYPNAFLLAEVYNPDLYREYLYLGKLDYLYDKVGLYDTLKLIMQGHLEADHLVLRLNELQDIKHSMLHFLENHDEQRIASPEFAGNAAKGKPAMVVSATVSTSPTMIYFGQEVGEPAADKAGFGSPSRTSIFDYIGVPHHQRWVNNKHFDGGQLSEEERSLRGFYKKLLNFTLNNPAMMGNFQEIHSHNRQFTPGYDPRIFSFLRWSTHQKLLILVNLSEENILEFELRIPPASIQEWGLDNGNYLLTDQLDQENVSQLNIQEGEGRINVEIGPLGSFIYELSS